MVRSITLVVGLLVAGAAAGQTLPLLDQSPTSLHWYRLTSPHFKVLFPQGMDTTAQRTLSRLESLYEPASASLGKQPRPISVVLQNQTTNSNGFVTLFPRHSEFFAIPPQDPGLLGTFNWLDLLAVHEYRHVVQNDKALQGYGRVLHTFLGNSGLFLPLLTVPDWFAEGDAVSNETLLSASGRGRIPNFDLGMRANLLAGRRFDYPKSVGGSYRDNVPDHYVLGYFLTTYLKRTYGPDVWSRVLNRNYRRFPWPFAFSASIKDVTGLRTEDLYRKTMDDLTETWQRQQAALTITPADSFPVSVEHPNGKTVFTNYQHPQYLNDSTLVCVKSGLGSTPRLVLLQKNAPEQTLWVQGFPNDPDMLSAAAGKVCWIEFGYDPRWGARIYSNIRLLDVNTRSLTRLTHRTRYMAAALSPDGTRLIVVENSAQYKSRLLVLSAVSETLTDTKGHKKSVLGRTLQVIPNPDQLFYLHPRWYEDGRTVYVVALRNGQKTIQQIDTQTGDQTNLLPFQNDNISHPQPWGKYVFYNSPRSGIDNIYALNSQTKEVFQVTSRSLAAYHAAISPNGDQLAFEDFSATGARIRDMPIDPSSWKPISSNTTTPLVRYFGNLPNLEPGAAAGRQILADTSLPAKPYTRSRFRRLTHALNIYSWGPTVSSSGQTLSAGLSSQDLLNTTQLSAGYAFNQSEQVGNFYALLSYQGLFPVFDISFQHGNRNTSLYVDKLIPADSLRTDQWQYNQLTAGVRLPLQLTRSKYIQGLSLSAYYNYLQVTGYDLPYRYITEVGGQGSLNAMTYSLSYSRLLRQSKRDVAPRWGQTLLATYRNTPFGGPLTAEQWGVQGNLYFPGLASHHSLHLRGGYQEQAHGSYLFSAVVFYPRGQSYISDDQIRAGSIEYRLPLADTHWSLGRWLYVQRIKANGFYDLADGKSEVEVRDVYGRLRGYQTVQHTYQTAGLDISFVFNALRLRTPFEAGFRSIYNLTSQQWIIQPLVIDIGF